MCLVGADVTGQLALPGATLVNTTGPALAAEAAQIDGDLLLDQDVVAAGTGQAGAVSLDGAVVRQVLSCSGWFASLLAGPPGACPGPALDLGRASVGTLRSRPPAAGFAADGGFRLDGLSYSGLPVLGDPELVSPRPQPDRRPSRWRRRPGRAGDPAPHQAVAQWLSWFRHETAEHADQPYAALAAAYRPRGAATWPGRSSSRSGRMPGSGPRRTRPPAGPAGRPLADRDGYPQLVCAAWLAGLLAVTVGLAVSGSGCRYVQPTAAAQPAGPAASAPPAASSPPAARPSPAGSAALAVRASPTASPSPSASPAPSATPCPAASRAGPRAARRDRTGHRSPGCRMRGGGPGRLRGWPGAPVHQARRRPGWVVRRAGHVRRARRARVRLAGPGAGYRPARELCGRPDRLTCRPARSG